MNRPRRLSQDDAGKLIALASILLGGWLRILPASQADFPINDGGLFYVMIRSIQQNALRLPFYVSYNGLSIPFAYPPISFLLTAFAGTALNLQVLDLLRWLPAVFTALTVPAVYLLARGLLGSELEAGLATMFFAFTPRGLTWLVMGGGLSRSLGELLLVLTVWSVFRVFTTARRADMLRAVLFSSLVVLTHPEAAIHSILACLLLWIFYGRGRAGAIQALTVGASVFVLTAPWWATVLVRYGVEPLVSAASTGGASWTAILSRFVLPISEEPYVTTVMVLGYLGLVASIMWRQWFLPLFFLLPPFLEPRNAANVAIIPLAFLSARALVQVILPAIAPIAGPGHVRPVRRSPLLGWMAGTVLALSLLFNAGYVSMQLATNHVEEGTLQAFSWVRENTATDARFVILTGEPDSFCDGVQEWFPALAERQSETTPQGREWIAGADFRSFRGNFATLQSCMELGRGCLEDVGREMGLDYDYLLIQRVATSKLFCIPRRETYRGGNLLLSLREDSEGRFSTVYETPGVVILSRAR